MTRQLLTINKFAKKYEAFSEGCLRWLIFNAQERGNSAGEVIRGNGLSEIGAILRIGRKVLIDEERFFQWVDEQNGVKVNRIEAQVT